MFHTSSQKKFWTFSDEDEIDTLRREVNQKFVEQHHVEAKVGYTIMSLSCMLSPFNAIFLCTPVKTLYLGLNLGELQGP